MRILVVGLGSMGRRRLRNLTHIGGHELAGVEPDEQRREQATGEHGIPGFATLEEGLVWAPKAVIISTPPDHHAEPARAAAAAGVSFFIEASVVPEDLSDLIGTVREKGIVGAPSCTMRFHPSVQTMERLIGESAIGEPLAVVHHMGQYLPDWHPWEDYRTFYVSRRATGAAREMVPFELNWLTGLFGEATDVMAMRAKLSDLETDIDDVYSMLVGFASGVRGTVTMEVLSRPGVRLARIIGSEGTLIWDWNAKHTQLWRAGTGEWETFEDPPPVEGPGGSWVAENMYISEMEAFTAAVAGGPAFPLSLEEDQRLLRTLTAVEESSDSGRRVELS